MFRYRLKARLHPVKMYNVGARPTIGAIDKLSVNIYTSFNGVNMQTKKKNEQLGNVLNYSVNIIQDLTVPIS